MRTAPIFVDSNVFLYAAGDDHPLESPCASIVTRIATGEVAATTSTEVVQEILHVVARRGMRAEAIRLARNVIGLFDEILPVTGETMSLACEIAGRHAGMSIRDAVHAAAMAGSGLGRILSADRHFDEIPGIERLDPGLPLL